MVYLLFFFALAAAVAAAVLLYIDNKRRAGGSGARPTSRVKYPPRRRPRRPASAVDVVDEAEIHGADAAETAVTSAVLTDAAAPVTPTSAHASSAEVPVSEPAASAAPATRTVAEETSDGDDPVTAETPVVPEQYPEPHAPAQPAPAEASEASAPRKPEPVPPMNAPEEDLERPATSGFLAVGLQLPGAGRRERKSWAESKGFDFAKREDALAGQWRRGAAAHGAMARDVVSGGAYNHEMLLVDLGDVTVMAMRTGAPSDVVVDMRRTGVDLGDKDSDDLQLVGEIAGFTLLSTNPGAVERMLDVRLVTALDQLPAAVTAVWCESEWVLAQTAKGAATADWDGMLAPLALIADNARTLPPQAAAETTVNMAVLTPSRAIGKAPTAEEEPAALHVVPDPVPAREATPVPEIIRSGQPQDLPVRGQGEARGVVEPRAVGGDEVDAIAEGTPPRRPYDSTRVERNLDGRSRIFDDAPDAADGHIHPQDF